MSKMLLLAQFAPTDGIMLHPPKTAEEVFYAETYHLKIIESLKRLNYDFDTASDIEYLLKNKSKYQLIWSLYNRLGFRNSEIFVQSLCEYLDIKYIGASPNVRALVEDKSMSKQLAEHIEIKTAKWVVASIQYPLSRIAPFPGSYFVKPRFGSASIGIDESCICETWDNAIVKTEAYFEQNIEVIVEKYIDGLSYGVPILNTPNGEPIISTPHYTTSSKAGNVMTYPQKRFAERGMSRCISNDKTLNTHLEHIALNFFMQMQPCDYARIDFILERDSMTPYFLEVNTLMNLGVHGGFVTSFLQSHFSSYDELIRHIVEVGLSKLVNSNSASNP